MSLLTSETVKVIETSFATDSSYEDFTLLRKNDRTCQYLATKAGKRFLLKTAASDSGKDLAMLKREYELSLGLSHPSLAYVFTYEPATEVGPCIVMEYVEGRSLEEFLQEKPSRNLRRKIFGQILDAIEYIHSHGVTHNDLAPQNILISNNGDKVKLIDFGFADDDCHYLAHSLGGTRKYASPELLAGEKVGNASDIWSLGSLLEDMFKTDFCRYGAIVRKCHKSAPCSRYESVNELRRAWSHYFRPIYYTAALVAAVLLGIFVAGSIQQRRELESLKQNELQKTETLEKAKSEVLAWYDDNIPAYLEQRKTCAPEDRVRLKSELCDRYSAFVQNLLASCPEEIGSELTYFLVTKYNADFPYAQ